MAAKRFKRTLVYFTALLAVSFGMEWGFEYILSAHSERRERKRPVAEAAP